MRMRVLKKKLRVEIEIENETLRFSENESPSLRVESENSCQQTKMPQKRFSLIKLAPPHCKWLAHTK